MPGDVGIVLRPQCGPSTQHKRFGSVVHQNHSPLCPLYALNMMIRSLTAAWDSSQNIELALDSRVLLFVLSVKADFAN